MILFTGVLLIALLLATMIGIMAWSDRAATHNRDQATIDDLSDMVDKYRDRAESAEERANQAERLAAERLRNLEMVLRDLEVA